MTIPDERIAGVLDGAVESPRREGLLSNLAAADEDYEVFADTASVLRVVEEEDARAVARRSQERADEGLMTAITATPAILIGLGLIWLAAGGPLWVGNVAIYMGAGLYALYAVVVVVWAWRYR